MPALEVDFDDEEERAINEGIASDPDTWEKTDEMFARATRGVPPEIAHLLGRRTVSLTLDQAVVDHFKGDDPEGFETSVNAALRKAAGLD